MTTMMQRPNLHELAMAAMEGTISKVAVSQEAARQLKNLGTPLAVEKTASTDKADDAVPTEYVHKLAGALDYMVKSAEIGTTTIQPGKGPNTLEVMEATSSETNIDAGQQGQATSKNVPPQSPPTQSSGVAKDPSNAMQTNDEMMHGEQPVDPMGNEKTSAVYLRNLEALGLSKVAKEEGGSRHVDKRLLFGTGGAAALGAEKGKRWDAWKDGTKHQLKEQGKGILSGGLGGAALGATVGAIKNRSLAGAGRGALAGVGTGALLGNVAGGLKSQVDRKGADIIEKHRKKEASLLERNLEALGIKQAEDESGAKLTGGGNAAVPPPGASPSEEQVPSEPSDVSKQKGLISSNDAAINYDKGQAKADPKSDVNKVLSEPALSAATDKTLQKTLDHTSQAGVKISSDLTRTAAAQALLAKLAQKAEEDAKKKKQSMMGQSADLSTPAAQSGFNANSM